MADAQVTTSQSEISFPQISVNSKDSTIIILRNESDADVNIFSVIHYSNQFSVSDTSFVILPKDSVKLFIYYSPVQNVIDKDIFQFQLNDSVSAAVISVSGSGKLENHFYDSTFNLYDKELKDELYKLINSHTALGYNLARDKMFMEIDNKKVNGQGASQNTLEGVYTGREAVGYTSRSDAQSSTYDFNTEHTWPQSNFNSNEPMKSDLYHLYPTDSYANNKRSNYPFGNVTTVSWQEGGSKLGSDGSATVFEPRDAHKGNVSRSMFYFITCYPQNYGNFFSKKQENVFRVWNVTDPVDTAEMLRNDAIASYQHNRNPFIDNPGFVNRIYDFVNGTSHPVYANLLTSQNELVFDSTAVGDTSALSFYLINSGDDQLRISSVSIDDSTFKWVEIPGIISEKNFSKVNLIFIPDSAGDYNSTITFAGNGGTKSIILKGIGKSKTTTAVKDNVQSSFDYNLYQNYPNPFNPSTTISYQIKREGLVSIKIYDVLGNEVKTLVNEQKMPGRYSVNFDAGFLSSGIYFYSIRINNFISTKSMVLLK